MGGCRERRSAWAWAVGAWVAALAGCGVAPGEAQAPSDAERTSLGLTSAACPGLRFVGVAVSTTCPQARSAIGGRWVVSRLAPSEGPGLNRFCAYDWEPSDPSKPAPPDTSALPPDGDRSAGKWLAPDCHVVAPLGSALGDEATVWTRLRQVALASADALSALPSRSGAPPAAVRVAVVDSAVEGYSSGRAGVGRFVHGRAVGRFIRELSCPPDGTSPNSACIGMVANHLALPRLSPTQVDKVSGGYFGTQSELALAILRAVTAWRNDQSSTTAAHPRMVINLSVGWDSGSGYGGEYGSDPSTLPGPTRLVHAALTHAACYGALVVVAAGNRSEGSAPTTGPMYPAGWEVKPAPEYKECQALEGSKYALPQLPVFSTSPAYRPLVYAVGGVDGRDQKLTLTRTAGRPSLAGYGYHVVSRDGATGTDVLTGTSMSAAEVSGIAATLWGYRPSLTAHQVMNLVYGSGVSLHPAPDGTAVHAEFCLGGACGTRPIRRASLCRALALACGGGSERCPLSLPACPARPAYSGSNVRWTDAEWSAAVSAVTSESAVPLVDGACTAPACVSPDALLPNKWNRPWVGPQPGWSGCDVCTIKQGDTSAESVSSPVVMASATPSPSTHGSGSTLYLALNDSFNTWDSVVLTLMSPSGTQSYSLKALVTDDTLQPVYQVSDILVPPDTRSATLSFRVGEYSTTEDVVLFAP